mmetsp:Transcript_502/g.1485  ORF Transcript_502/g.1485 Transcript_502/m.1485 type:complete len:211 (+) Transcript_502:1213-1845(+)
MMPERRRWPSRKPVAASSCRNPSVLSDPSQSTPPSHTPPCPGRSCCCIVEAGRQSGAAPHSSLLVAGCAIAALKPQPYSRAPLCLKGGHEAQRCQQGGVHGGVPLQSPQCRRGSLQSGHTPLLRLLAQQTVRGCLWRQLHQQRGALRGKQPLMYPLEHLAALLPGPVDDDEHVRRTASRRPRIVRCCGLTRAKTADRCVCAVRAGQLGSQ